MSTSSFSNSASSSGLREARSSSSSTSSYLLNSLRYPKNSWPERLNRRNTRVKQNIPSDYEIPVSYIPKEVAGTCWVVLNIYPLEQSLRKLANMFGTISSNKENVVVFIAMLKSLRFTFDHEELETAMQLFQCHYQEGSLTSGLYFDYIKDVLHVASKGTSGFSSSLGSFYQFATLKIAKWPLLTRSQLCLSPSHFKHSPTPLTLSQWGRHP
ncbi:hypothetical protein F7725_021992 [Dissostichus mawsoni]|uniref:Kit ligand n=1 Tax=Dissostichus mawsoni TaxID=36200 RepID=A0A7J5ZDD7_DISMA|nr:hypothetical protein F7725_021992 [Dissostichus mawsoni]